MKSRNWTFIHYKEHGNQHQLADYLQSANLMYAISPCHKEGKPHYHVVLQFSGPVTEKTIISEIVQPLNDPVYIQKVYSMSAIDEYLTHDNVSKRKYDRNKIIYSDNWITYNSDDTSTLDLIKQLADIIQSNNIRNYYDLLSYLILNKNNNLIDFCVKHTYCVDKFIITRYTNRGNTK